MLKENDMGSSTECDVESDVCMNFGTLPTILKPTTAGCMSEATDKVGSVSSRKSGVSPSRSTKNLIPTVTDCATSSWDLERGIMTVSIGTQTVNQHDIHELTSELLVLNPTTSSTPNVVRYYPKNATVKDLVSKKAVQVEETAHDDNEVPGLAPQLNSKEKLTLSIKTCVKRKCITCKSLTNGSCSTENTVYLITCTLDNCNATYIGQTHRKLRDRFTEHVRVCTNPDYKSYRNLAFSVHYSYLHPGEKPQLSVRILETVQNRERRRERESALIVEMRPSLNLTAR